MRRTVPALLALGLAAGLFAGTHDRPAEGRPQGLEIFKARVRPLLTAKCLKCHGGRKTEGKWDVTTREKMLLGGKHHKAKTVIPYEPDKSKLLLMVQKLAKPGMPPKGEWLSVQEIKDLYVWIHHGAPYDGPLSMPK
jgi:mono/diheme cytochrome c family protein